MAVRDVLIIGAGPSGLAAGIAAKQQGLDYVIVEKGVLVNSIFHFPVHMVFFTTPELLEIGGLPLVTPYDKPTRLEALRYYRRVVDTYALPVNFHEEVTDIHSPAAAAGSVGAGFPPTPPSGRGATRQASAGSSVRPLGGPTGRDLAEAPLRGAEAGSRPEGAFSVTTKDQRGVTQVRHARAVVLAIGYYDNPNLLSVPGEDLPHVSHYYTDAHPYYRHRVVIVGGKNSAAEAALELFRAGCVVTIVHRRPALGDSIKYWVKPDIENRIKEGSIAARFNTRVVEITQTHVIVEQDSPETGQVSRDELPADGVFLLTGYHPDVELMERAGVRCDPITLAPEFDKETFETNVPNLFVAGGAIAGKNTGTIFIENGRFHGERIIKILSERFRAD